MRSNPTIVTAASARALLRRVALGTTALFVSFFVLLSCVGEPTAPQKGVEKFARGLSFNPVFPQGLSAFSADQFAFDRVHVILRHTDGSVALDTTVAFPDNVASVSVSFDVRLLPGTPASGEMMRLEVVYLNTIQEVFRGGVEVVATPTVPGAEAPPPVSVPDVNLVYTGPGSAATRVVIAPRTLSVNTGGSFAFTATATDATGNTVPNTPIAWSTLDPTRATLTAPTAGSGVALSQRGVARIVAQLVGGQKDTVSLTVNPVATAIAAVSGGGQTGIVGKPVTAPLAQPLVVRVTAADGLGVSGAAVSFAAANGGSVSPASAVTDANGNAQTTWTLGPAAGPQSATATASGLSGSPVSFSATAQPTVPTKLLFTTAPAASSVVSSGAAIALAVTVQDAAGDRVASFTGPVSLSVAGGAASSTLGGTTTVNAVAGIATFSNVSVAAPGTGYVITASATGLTAASTPAFDVIAGAAANMQVVAGGGQSANAGSALSPITVLLTDANGNAKVNAIVTFAVTSGGGSVAPTSIATDAAGKATTVWTLGPTPGPQTISASSVGVTTLSIPATAVSTTNHWVVTTQPAASHTAGVAISPAIVAELRDAANAIVASYNGSATVALNATTSGAALSGTTTVTAVNGVATFSNVVLNKSFQGYTLDIGAANTVSATTTAFNVIPSSAATLAIQSGNNQTGALGSPLGQPIVALVTDQFGNGVSGVQVTFAVSSGGGSITPATATTTANGTASAQWTLGQQGTQSLSVSATGLSGSPATVNATPGAGPLATTVVAPHLDTLTSFTDTRQISPTGRDLAGNIVNGTWTWVSRNPAVATVNSSGLVTSVANGSTYIVATETGGSKDSAQIVVQQRIASVSVTPATRSIYVTGTFNFTAQAVDGRGVPMGSQPTFTWSSTQPTVASVNASGFVTGLAIGTTQIRATSGTTTGVSNLSVLTPITRIDVSFDSTGAPAPDNFTMPSLGDRRMYRALARDTLLNPMTGVTFTWNSSNASVALIDSTTGTQARALSAANGITTIQASAQGVTGGATLNVSQVLSSIELTPLTATVAVAGTTPMLARGKDANGRYISGGTFTYSSSVPSVATIGATSGVVSGVANGSTVITAASGNITSNAASVSVNNSGPAIISFGRDTIGVGRGTSLSIPILLSKPSASAITVALSAADTTAFFSQSSVTINAGQTSANATLNGRNAGTTRIFAIDASQTGYAGDTAVVAVQANLRMTTTSYSMVANDQISTQVLLSDPSPAGGTYVTFSYSVQGRVSVSPDPAYIPPGQLAADVVIRGLTAGSASITPSATGVTGTAASVNVQPATLFLGATSIRLGQGQFEPNVYVQVPNVLFAPLTVTLTSSDTNVVTVPPSVIISNPNYTYFNTTARGVGSARVIATAPGWAPDTFTVVTTTPMVRVCCANSSLNVTSALVNLNVYAADSVRTIHSRTSSLAVRLTSSDSTVMRVLDTLVTIPAGQQTNSGNNARVIPGGTGGTAWIKSTAGGHTADSVLFTVAAPKLNFSYTSQRLGNGQQESGQYIQLPNAIGSQLVVTLTSSDSNIVAVDQQAIIPGQQNYQYFLQRAKSTGTATIIASAPGYAPDTATTIVTTPKIDLTGAGTLNAFSTTSTSAYTRDSTFTVHNRTLPLTVTLTSSDTTVLTVDSVLTIPAGQYYPNTSANIVAIGPGTARIIATAPGHTPDTNTWTVIAPKLSLSWVTNRIGARQLETQVYVQTPTTRNVAVPVTLTQKQPSRIALSSTTLTLPANQSYEYFNYTSLTQGRDTIIATSPGYLPDTAFIIVSTPQLDASNLPSTIATTSPPSTVTVYSADTTFTSHIANDTVVVRAFSTDSNVIRPVQQYFRIIKGQYYGQVSIAYVGAGTARMVFSDSAGTGYRPDSTNIVTVTGPSLTICCGTGRLGMRQHTSNGQFYVQTQNNVASPLTVNLVSTDPRVVTVPATVTIPQGSNYVYFPITALDTLGTIQIQATATGYSIGTSTMQVTAPKFVVQTSSTRNTTSGQANITVYATDANGTQHETNEDVVVQLLSSAPGVAAIDSNTVTIQANNTYNTNARWTPGAVGTATISAQDNRAVFYKYGTASQVVNVVTPNANLSFNTLTLGFGQYSDEYVQLPDNTAVALTVPISHAAVPRTTTPGSVTIPQGISYEYFRITGSSIGSDTITVSPPNHNPDAGVVIVGQGRIDPISGWPSTLQAGDSVQLTIYTRDPNQSIRSVQNATTFNLSSNANIRFVSGGQQSATITSVVVPAASNQVSFWVKGVTTGTASGTITSTNYTTYQNTITVTP